MRINWKILLNFKTDSLNTFRPPSCRTRRPDRAVYVPPRAKRSLTTPPASTTTSNANNHQKSHHHNRHEAIKNHSKSIDLNENSSNNLNFDLNLSSPESSDQFVDSTADNFDISTVISPACDQEFLQQQSQFDLLTDKLKDKPPEEESVDPCKVVTTSTNLPVSCDPNLTNQLVKEEVKISDSNKTIQKNQKNLSNMHKMTEKAKRKPLTIENAGGLATADKEDKEEKELRRASQEINRSNRKLIKQTFNSDVLEIEPHLKEKEKTRKRQEKPVAVAPEADDEDDWDSKFDENGECLDEKMIKELTSAVGKVSIEKPKSDYKVCLM